LLAVIPAPLLTAVGYFCAAKIGEWLAFPSAPVSALWAPNAIVLAALLLTQRDRWWQHLIAVLPLHFLAQLPESPFAQVVIQYVVNSAEALLGAYVIQLWSTHPRQCGRLRTAIALVVAGGVIAPLVTSFAMATAFAVAGIRGEFWLTILARTITNTFAVVAIVPLIVHSVERLRTGRGQVSLAHLGEASALAVALGLTSMLVFVVPNNGSLHALAFLYMPLPFLAWGAVRFGVPGACASALLVGAIATWGVLHGHGPFSGLDPVADALSIVTFHVVTVVTFVLLAALIGEWKLATRALKTSESRFRNIFEHNIIPTVTWADDALITDANEAFLQLTGFSRADIARARIRIDQFIERPHEPAPREPSPDPLERFSVSEQDLRLADGRHIPVVLGELRSGAAPAGFCMRSISPRSGAPRPAGNAPRACTRPSWIHWKIRSRFSIARARSSK
jgi:PAS domain S-box-containing protein